MENSETKCILCNRGQFNLLYPGKDRLEQLPGTFQVVECANCGLITLLPRKSAQEIALHYPENYVFYYQAVEDEKGWLKRLDRERGRERRCKEVLKRSVLKGRILDIGCATGIFLSGMQLHGWDCYGVEPSEYAANYAKTRFGLKVFHGYLEDMNYPDHYFDVVTLWDVLEHIPDPGRTLDIIHRILKPDGILIGTLPNASAWERGWFGEYWAGWEVPRHYNTFTPKTITTFLNIHNLKVEEIFSFTGRHGVFLMSVGFCLADWKRPEWFKKGLLHLLQSLLFRIIAHPYYLFAELLNKSPIMTFCCRVLKET
jgi:2-polyprenyl-3-methyl-5-hydroxy-6-metoxy-1,4-benzoquinol methylase